MGIQVGVIHYRFASSVEWAVIPIEAKRIHVNQLRDAIMAKEGLCHAFLLISDLRSGALLSGYIPAYSQIILVRFIVLRFNMS